MKKSIITPTLLALVYLFCSAHFIWTETDGLARAGEKHTVDFFFGEVNFHAKEQAGGRLDEMDGMKAVVRDKRGKTEELVLTKQNDRFSSRFIPEHGNVYEVLAQHTGAKVMDLRRSGMGIVKPAYYARQFVVCPGLERPDPLHAMQPEPYFPLDMLPDHSGSVMNAFAKDKPLRFTTFFNKLPVKGGKIFAHAPNGWSKEIDADSEGRCSFTPLWRGRYVIDFVYTENKPGSHQGQEYEAVRHRMVLTLWVK